MGKSLGASECVNLDLKDQNTWGQATDGVTKIFSSSMDALIEEHMNFAKFIGEKKTIDHVVRISCMGADTNTNSYDSKVHASLANTEIPLMLQHYWWSEECLKSWCADDLCPREFLHEPFVEERG